MREIKFRAWDKKYAVMREVDSIDFAFPQIDEGGTTYPMCDLVLMQFTGLKDKNGIEICEGDIVKNDKGIKSTYRRKSPHDYYVVQWQIDKAKFIVETYNGDFKVYPDLSHRVGWEIIGNIYENPELLKDQPNDPT